MFQLSTNSINMMGEGSFVVDDCCSHSAESSSSNEQGIWRLHQRISNKSMISNSSSEDSICISMDSCGSLVICPSSTDGVEDEEITVVAPYNIPTFLASKADTGDDAPKNSAITVRKSPSLPLKSTEETVEDTSFQQTDDVGGHGLEPAVTNVQAIFERVEDKLEDALSQYEYEMKQEEEAHMHRLNSQRKSGSGSRCIGHKNTVESLESLESTKAAAGLCISSHGITSNDREDDGEILKEVNLESPNIVVDDLIDIWENWEGEQRVMQVKDADHHSESKSTRAVENTQTSLSEDESEDGFDGKSVGSEDKSLNTTTTIYYECGYINEDMMDMSSDSDSKSEELEESRQALLTITSRLEEHTCIRSANAVVSVEDENLTEDLSKSTSSLEVPTDQKMSNIEMVDNEKLYTEEWSDCSNQIKSRPFPDHELHSSLVDAIISRWSHDPVTRLSLMVWMENIILNGANTTSAQSLRLSGMNDQTREEFMMHVLPLLLRREDVNVHLATRAQTTYDIAVRVTPASIDDNANNQHDETSGDESKQELLNGQMSENSEDETVELQTISSGLAMIDDRGAHMRPIRHLHNSSDEIGCHVNDKAKHYPPPVFSVQDEFDTNLPMELEEPLLLSKRPERKDIKADGTGGAEQHDIPNDQAHQLTPTDDQCNSSIFDSETVVVSNTRNEKGNVPTIEEADEAQIRHIAQVTFVGNYSRCQLSFTRGSVVEANSNQQGTWWLGRCGGQSGWFPKSAVVPVSKYLRSSIDADLVGTVEHFSSSAVLNEMIKLTLESDQADDSGSEEAQRKEVDDKPVPHGEIDFLLTTLVHSQTASNDEDQIQHIARVTFVGNYSRCQLSFIRGSKVEAHSNQLGPWWLGRCGGQSGWFPACTVISASEFMSNINNCSSSGVVGQDENNVANLAGAGLTAAYDQLVRSPSYLLEQYHDANIPAGQHELVSQSTSTERYLKPTTQKPSQPATAAHTLSTTLCFLTDDLCCNWDTACAPKRVWVEGPENIWVAPSSLEEFRDDKDNKSKGSDNSGPQRDLHDYLCC